MRQSSGVAKPMEELGPWFHNRIVGRVRAAPDHFLGDYPEVRYRRYRNLLPADMTRMTVLEITVASDYPITEPVAFEAPEFPKMHFVEHRYANDPTNWWTSNRAGMEAMLQSSGFRIEAQPEDETYLCRWEPFGKPVDGPHCVYPAKGA